MGALKLIECDFRASINEQNISRSVMKMNLSRVKE